MEIKREFTFYDLMDECWEGAISTLDTIREHDKQGEFMQLLQNTFYDTPTIEEVNDYLRYNYEDIYNDLGIEEEEEEEEV